MSHPADSIMVLDYGGQYAHLIAKKVRDLGYFSEILPGDSSADQVKHAKGIIISGGPQSVNKKDSVFFDQKILKLGIPVLGLCLGHQLVGHYLGGHIANGSKREYGKTHIQAQTDAVLFQDQPNDQIVWMSHFDVVDQAPEHFRVTASSDTCPIAAMEWPEKEIYSLQFHPEVTHTEYGLQMLKAFLERCPMQPNWNLSSLVPYLISDIQQQAKGKNVFILVSGGIDSTVCFVLLNQALGKDRVYGLHVDTGMMRKNESTQVKDILLQLGLDNFHVVDEGQRFIDALKEVYEPEQKRHIIGQLFLEVQQEQVAKLHLNPEKWLLGQGTLYPDTIESGGSEHAHTIKTHHNRIPEIEAMIQAGQVIEPLAELYKDEVRKVGTELQLPEDIIWRHTFPGPGLAVQQLCAKQEDLPKNPDQVIEKINEILQSQGESQLIPHILPVKSVGVQGDERTYAHAVALQGLADWKTYERVAIDIANSLSEINRVVRLIAPKSIDWHQTTVKPGYISPDRLELHREADVRANAILKKHGLERTLYEFPVVLFPVSLGGGESVALRPLYSENVMTVEFAKLPEDIVEEMARSILQLPCIDAVFYDVTNKPPATVQWE